MLRLPFRRAFTVLAFESSADDSCVALVDSSRKILANVVLKQDVINKSFGGIHPYVAIDQHQANLPIALRKALDEANLTVDNVDGIAFTRGPGMGGCLSVSMNAAKALAAAHRKPLVGVHHMQAHALTALLTQPADRLPTFPFLTLLLSGGHSMFVLAQSPTNFTIISQTRDEALGIALDKGARALGLPPSGAALEQFARRPESSLEPLSKPPMAKMMDLSFAGIRSQLDRRIKAIDDVFGGRAPSWIPLPHFPGNGPLPQPVEVPMHLDPQHENRLRELAWTFQDACFSHVRDKVVLVLQWCYSKLGIPMSALVVSGGVASNAVLREKLTQALVETQPHVPLICPPPELCTDNAAMIAWASMDRFLAGDHDDFGVTLRPVWTLDQLSEEQVR